MPATGWHPDPEGRNETRYYNGERWTEYVTNHGNVTKDDGTGPPPKLMPSPPPPAPATPTVAAASTVVESTPPSRLMAFRRWRFMTWVIWVWCLLILYGAIGGGASNDCAKEADQVSQDACAVGTGIGVALLLFIGFVGFVFLSLIWFMTRPRPAVATTN